MENHYCSGCGATTRFTPTDRFVEFAGHRYQVLLCIHCCKDLWKLVAEGGRKVAEISDG